MKDMVEIPIADIADTLSKTNPSQGLTTEEANARLEKYGRNEIPEKVKTLPHMPSGQRDHCMIFLLTNHGTPGQHWYRR